MPPAPATSEMLAEMSAWPLGMVFGAEAERTDDWARRPERDQLFDLCFFAVRVATAGPSATPLIVQTSPAAPG